MGVCQFCGQRAGWFRSAHKECRQQNAVGQSAVLAAVGKSISGTEPLDSTDAAIQTMAEKYRLTQLQIHDQAAHAWERQVVDLLDAGPISEGAEHRLMAIAKKFDLGQHDLDRHQAFTRLAKSAVLRDVTSGVISQRYQVEGALPFNFLKNEKLVWAFSNTKYLEDKVRREFVGRSSGVSVRIAKGVYYRAGAFKGRPVEHTQRVLVDSGVLAITNLHLYFAGQAKKFRIPYKKIVSFEHYSDGIGVMRDASTAKAQIFVTGDGWFTGNLVTNLAQL